MENKDKIVNLKFKELWDLIDVADKRIDEGLHDPGKEWEKIDEFLFTLKEEDFTDFALLCLTGETNE